MKFWFSTIVSILKIRKQKYNKWVEVTEIRERNIVKYIPSARECRLCYVASSVLGHLFQTHIQDLHFSNFSLLSSAAPVRVPVMLKNLLKYIKMDCEGPEVCILTNFWVDFLNLALKNCSKVTRLNKSLPLMKTITYISLYITLKISHFLHIQLYKFSLWLTTFTLPNWFFPEFTEKMKLSGWNPFTIFALHNQSDHHTLKLVIRFTTILWDKLMCFLM